MDTDSDIIANESLYPDAILRGGAANLQPLKQVETQATFLSQRSEGGPILADPIACRFSGPAIASSEIDEIDSCTVEGEIFVSSSQILFVAKSVADDWAIGARCILMHAMTEEPELSIYLQLQADSNESIEVSLTPLDSESCQAMFNALCKLVSSHPIEDDEEDERGEYFGQDDLIWAPLTTAFCATEKERQAMLDHLDSILVVNPEFSIQDGQFDDAEE
jgi:hypothetical protein